MDFNQRQYHSYLLNREVENLFKILFQLIEKKPLYIHEYSRVLYDINAGVASDSINLESTKRIKNLIQSYEKDIELEIKNISFLIKKNLDNQKLLINSLDS